MYICTQYEVDSTSEARHGGTVLIIWFEVVYLYEVRKYEVQVRTMCPLAHVCLAIMVNELKLTGCV